jgi:tetratricopeptide (TPR) repeat protein
MQSRSRRICQLWLLLTSLFQFQTGIYAESLNPVKVFFTYDHLLDIAEQKIITDQPSNSFSFLAKALDLRPEPEFRYFNLTGDAFWKLGKQFEAMEAYRKSADLNPNQNLLELRIADFYESERKPELALLYNQRFLKLVPTDKYRIFKSAILSRRIGKEADYQTYIQSLENDNSFASEGDSLQSSLTKNIKLKKWKESEDLALRYLPFFPRVEGLFETLILARRGTKSPLIEDAYTMACVTFKEETRYFVRFGVYMQENNRYLESLSLFRRAFFNSLKYNAKGDRGEFLFLLRQSYANLGWEKETLAIDSLGKDIKNRDTLTDDVLENHIQTYRKNREYLLFGVYWFRSKNSLKADYYRTLLRKRDEESSEKEFLFVIGPFSLERLEL